ncbi:DUF2252 domain-containing protein [Limosilactobacillus secaliphilus]|uniref:DUF2252 domain-containing protein n=1 Tax=Limosilactobacillus secaliphilus TaxID=396268 RepID=A0A0R2I1G3_9LACO|nr:DUF2252 domain-containing protein [Limosilactobacillus secaliphilus]KRN59008.1 hypothetical protein IV45_GL000042 [Limosilactobacillus secaliphilus]
MLDQQLDIFDLKKIQVRHTKAEFVKMGQAAQAKVSSKALATYHDVQRDPLQYIQYTESKMIQELLPLRHGRMMVNPFTFYRGTAELMEEDLKHQSQSQVLTILCGDAHVNNFGFYASPERQLLFGLNDFDEARIGNWESDLKRLLVSVELAGQLNGFSQANLTDLIQQITKTYRHAIKRSNRQSLSQIYYFQFQYQNMVDIVKEMGDDHSAEQLAKILQKILTKSQRSNSEQIVKKMCVADENGHLRFKDNEPRARHVGAVRYQEILSGYRKYRDNAREDIRIFLANFGVEDIIRYSVGVGSFGTRCYLLLLTGNDGSHLVLQIKEALPLRYNLLAMPVNAAIASGPRSGRRIVTAQRTLQSSSDPFLAATSFAGRSYYVRQFRDMKESIDVLKLDFESYTLYCETCALLLATAHYRTPIAPMIRGYLKQQKALDKGLAQWALAYTKQVEKDYDCFVHAIKNGQLAAVK